MKSQIPWLRVFVEGVVIVGSILLAFGIEAWWDGRQERVEEHEALASLEQEFTGLRDGLDRAEDRFRPLGTSLEYTHRTLVQALREGDTSVAIPDTVLAWAFTPPTLQPNLETLNSLVSSGRLEIISDRELRSALAGWGRVLEEMTENQITSREYVFTELDRVLRTRMDISSFRLLRGDINRGTATPEQLGASSEVPVDLEIVGVFATRLATHRRTDVEMGPVREQVDRIVSLIARSWAP